MDSVHPIGGRPCKAPTNAELPFTDIQVWFKLRLQTTEIHTNTVLPAQTVFASLPKGEWKCGHYDSVVVNINDTKVWPTSGLEGTASDFTVSYTLLIPFLIRTFYRAASSHHASLGQAL